VYLSEVCAFQNPEELQLSDLILQLRTAAGRGSERPVAAGHGPSLDRDFREHRKPGARGGAPSALLDGMALARNLTVLQVEQAPIIAEIPSRRSLNLLPVNSEGHNFATCQCRLGHSSCQPE
jgi:hypothetical protein